LVFAPYVATLVGLGVLVALAVFFWQWLGPGSGRGFGNRVAAQVGIPRNAFHALLAHGAKGSPRELLAQLQASGMGVERAGEELGPVLARGIERMEAHFGPQDMVDAAKPVVAALVAAQARRAAAEGPGA
jgi:hypothetical protein